MHRVCLCIKDICADLFHYFKLTTLEQPHNWLFLFSGCQEPEGQRGKSTEWGGGTERERERESPQTWSVTLNINGKDTIDGGPFYTPRGLPRGKLQKFLIPYEREYFKGTVSVWSLFQLSQSERKGNTRDNPTSMWEANPYEQSENMQTLQRSSVSP